MKKSWVDEHFRRIGKLDITCDTIIPSPAENPGLKDLLHCLD